MLQVEAGESWNPDLVRELVRSFERHLTRCLAIDLSMLSPDGANSFTMEISRSTSRPFAWRLLEEQPKVINNCKGIS